MVFNKIHFYPSIIHLWSQVIWRGAIRPGTCILKADQFDAEFKVNFSSINPSVFGPVFSLYVVMFFSGL